MFCLCAMLYIVLLHFSDSQCFVFFWTYARCWIE